VTTRSTSASRSRPVPKRASAWTYTHLLMECLALLLAPTTTSSSTHFVLANPACHAYLVYIFLHCVCHTCTVLSNRIETNCFMTMFSEEINIYHHHPELIHWKLHPSAHSHWPPAHPLSGLFPETADPPQPCPLALLDVDDLAQTNFLFLPLFMCLPSVL
jgi:hypothetical protein